MFKDVQRCSKYTCQTAGAFRCAVPKRCDSLCNSLAKLPSSTCLFNHGEDASLFSWFKHHSEAWKSCSDMLVSTSSALSLDIDWFTLRRPPPHLHLCFTPNCPNYSKTHCFSLFLHGYPTHHIHSHIAFLLHRIPGTSRLSCCSAPTMLQTCSKPSRPHPSLAILELGYPAPSCMPPSIPLFPTILAIIRQYQTINLPGTPMRQGERNPITNNLLHLYTERLKSTNCMELCQVSLGRRWIRKSNKLTKNQGNPNGTPRYDKLYFGKFCCVKDEDTHCGRNYQTIVKVALNFTKKQTNHTGTLMIHHM